MNLFNETHIASTRALNARIEELFRKNEEETNAEWDKFDNAFKSMFTALKNSLNKLTHSQKIDYAELVKGLKFEKKEIKTLEEIKKICGDAVHKVALIHSWYEHSGLHSKNSFEYSNAMLTMLAEYHKDAEGVKKELKLCIDFLKKVKEKLNKDIKLTNAELRIEKETIEPILHAMKDLMLQCESLLGKSIDELRKDERITQAMVDKVISLTGEGTSPFPKFTPS